MKKIIFLVSSLLLFGLSACSILNKKNPEPEPALVSSQEQEVLQIERRLDDKDFDRALELIEQFRISHPVSIFDKKIQLQQAKAYEGMSDCQQALQIYDEVLKSSVGRQEEFVARALFRSSYCYEALGEDLKSLAALKDAYKLKHHLSPGEGWAELPARLAAASMRAGATSEADVYFKEAERGLIALSQRPEQTDVTRSKIFFQMGQTQAGVGSKIQTEIQSFSRMQLFLIKSMELNVNPWAQEAQQNLIKSYENFFSRIQNESRRPDLDPVAAERELSDRQRSGVVALQEALDSFYDYQSPSGKQSQTLSEAINFLQNFSKKLSRYLESPLELNPMTSEAQKRRALKQDSIQLEDPEHGNPKSP